MSTLADSILTLPPWVALLLVFALPALEASAFVGFVFPGEIAAILGGVLAFNGRLPLPVVIAAAVLGAIVGDSVGYAIGRRFGPGLLGRLPQRVVRPDHVERAKGTINRLGGKAVFVGRFTAALRVLVPGLCGIAAMPYRTFAFYNVTGGFIWAGGSVLLGYAAGSSYHTLEHSLSLFGYVALGVVLVLLAALWLRHRRRRSSHEPIDDEARRSYRA